MEWTEETMQRLRAFWTEGVSTAEIGRRLGVTKNAVVGKAHRLELLARPSPIRWDPEAPRTRRRDDAPPHANGPTLPPLPPLPTLPARPAAPPPPAAAPRPVARPEAPPPPARPAAALPLPPRPVAPPRLVTLPPSRAYGGRIITCCWPIGEPGTREFHFCDDPALTGKPYCEAHAALAYVKVRDRREDAA